MATKRLELPDGQWAEIRTKPNHGQNLRISIATERATTGRGSFSEWASTVGRQMTETWFVRNEQGETITLSDAGWESAPGEIIDAICTQAQEQWSEWQKNRPEPLVKPIDEPETSA